jgi:amino acid transporter
MPDSSDVPADLIVWSVHTPPPRRRWRRLLAIGVIAVAVVALVWPVYAFFGRVEPFILGVPLSMAWMAFWGLVVFAARALLHRHHHPPVKAAHPVPRRRRSAPVEERGR